MPLAIWTAIRTLATTIIPGVVSTVASSVGQGAGWIAEKIGGIAIIVGLWVMITHFVPGATIETTPVWIAGIEDIFFPAYMALSKLPIIGTMVWILKWVVIFEMTMFLVKLLLRLAEWANLTGKNPYDY